MTADVTDDGDVTGLVLHFRTPVQTGICLKSLAVEGIRRVILIDNSEDEGRSIRILGPLIEELLGEGLRIEILRPSENLGFSKGMSLGLQHIADQNPTHVLVINSDARIEPGGLRAMMVYLEYYKCVSLSSRRTATDNAASSIAFYHKLMALYLRRPVIGAIAYPSGCCLLLRRDLAFNDIFDCDFFFYGDDVMLGFEFAQRGVAFTECKEFAVIHEVSSSARNGSIFYEYHMVRAHWLLARKLAPSKWEMMMFVAARCAILPLRAIVRSFRRRSLVPFYGLIFATVDVMRRRCRNFTPPA